MTDDTQSIRIVLFRDSREPFLELLREHGIGFVVHPPPVGVPTASGEWVEVLTNPFILGSLATVVVAFLKHRHSRKIIIKTKSNTVVHGENLTHEELLQFLEKADTLTVIDARRKGAESQTQRSIIQTQRRENR